MLCLALSLQLEDRLHDAQDALHLPRQSSLCSVQQVPEKWGERSMELCLVFKQVWNVPGDVRSGASNLAHLLGAPALPCPRYVGGSFPLSCKNSPEPKRLKLGVGPERVRDPDNLGQQ